MSKTTKGRPKKRKKKFVFPKEYEDLWNKDYYDLTDKQRIMMVELYIQHLNDYEWGKVKKKEKPPLFMTQEEIVRKEEKDKRKKVVEERRAKEDVVQRENRERSQILEKARRAWENDRVIVLSKTEKLELENLQLKIELAQKTMIDLEQKRKKLLKEQEETAVKIEKKYEIIMDEYNIDLIQGLCVRGRNIIFPYTAKTIEDIPDKYRK